MKKLIIKEPGLFLRIPGMGDFRTPAEIDISKIDVNLVLAELRRNGISTYKIHSDEQTKSKNVNIQKKDIKDIRYEDILELMQKQQNSMGVIENLLKTMITTKTPEPSMDMITNLLNDFLQSDKTNTTEIKKKSKIDESVDEFIPEININKMTLKGNNSSKVIKSDRSILKNAESLKSLKGDK